MYDSACTASGVDVEIPSREVHAQIRGALFFDRRQSGSHGRSLLVDILVGAVWLLKGDRLEPSEFLDDVFAFDGIRHFPAWVRFWRPSAQTVSLHRNQLFRVKGFGIRRLVPDILHCL